MKFTDRIKFSNKNSLLKREAIRRAVEERSQANAMAEKMNVEKDADAMMQMLLTNHLADVIKNNRPEVKVINQQKKIQVHGSVSTPELVSLPEIILGVQQAVIDLHREHVEGSERLMEVHIALLQAVTDLREDTLSNKEVYVQNLSEIAPIPPVEPLKSVSSRVTHLPGYVAEDLGKVNKGIRDVVRAVEKFADKETTIVDVEPVSKEVRSLSQTVKQLLGFGPKADAIAEKIEKAVDKVTRAVIEKPIPVPTISLPRADDQSIKVTVVSGGGSGGSSGKATDAYAPSDLDDLSTTKYYGFLKDDGAWYIMRKDATSIRYSAGSSGYNWSNRASLTYTTYDIAF